MSEAAPREWRFYLDDMIGFCEKVIAYSVHAIAQSSPNKRRQLCRLSFV